MAQPLSETPPTDVIVIGSGIGGLVAAALLARYGQRMLVCESHSIPGGAAHAFQRDGFEVDSGPSFYCGLADPNSLNPLQQVLAVLDEPFLLRHYPGAVVKFLGQLQAVGGSAGQIADQTVTDPWVRYLFELECFLLSGMSAHDTVAPEMAFMFGERTGSVIDYPIGGSGAIVAALVRGLAKFGGELRLKAHVDQILVEDNQVQGVRLKSGRRSPRPL